MAETVAAALLRLRRQFEAEGIATAALDARLMVQRVLDVDHAELIASPERCLTHEESTRLTQLGLQRSQGEPYSRIAGVREFYGRAFAISKAVLDPRPDTESIIELCLRTFSREAPLRFVDLGVGSGAIAVTLLAEFAQAQGVAVDVSHKALAIARDNAMIHGVIDRLALVESDWFSSVTGEFDLIVSNPPYIRTADIATLGREVRDHDPLLALDGGEDGLSCYRLIASQSGAHLAAGGRVVVEAGHDQADDIKYIFRSNRFQLTGEIIDLSGFIRGLVFARD